MLAWALLPGWQFPSSPALTESGEAAVLRFRMSVMQYEAQIHAIVEQAQQVGQPDEGLWCCTIV